MDTQLQIKDVVNALDKITGGRVLSPRDKNPFVVTKSSNIPGKAVTETPGLVVGDPAQPVKKLAVMMTLTESAIELAGATGVDAVLAHHPIADAANSGGVLLKTYLGLYRVAALELHEAFHGLHPGIAYIHGHDAAFADICYSHIPGNILFVGNTLENVTTLQDMLDRINIFMDLSTDQALLEHEKKIRDCNDIAETAVFTQGQILEGRPGNTVGKVMHIFPHTGFTPAHMERALNEHPGIDTVLATISRVFPGHELVQKAKGLGLNFVCGNSHALEIMENGLPLAYALQSVLPGLDVVIFKERMTSIPIRAFGGTAIWDYARKMAENHLIPEKK